MSLKMTTLEKYERSIYQAELRTRVLISEYNWKFTNSPRVIGITLYFKENLDKIRCTF